MANQTLNTPSTSSNTDTINVASLSNAIAVALQQASDHHTSSLSPPFQSLIPAVSASSSTAGGHVVLRNTPQQFFTDNASNSGQSHPTTV